MIQTYRSKYVPYRCQKQRRYPQKASHVAPQTCTAQNLSVPPAPSLHLIHETAPLLADSPLALAVIAFVAFITLFRV